MNQIDDGKTAFGLLAGAGVLFATGVVAACFGNWTILELWLIFGTLTAGWLWLHF